MARNSGSTNITIERSTMPWENSLSMDHGFNGYGYYQRVAMMLPGSLDMRMIKIQGQMS